MIRWAVVAITEKSVEKALYIKKSCSEIFHMDIYTLNKYSNEQTLIIEGDFKNLVKYTVDNYSTIVFIMATGIVVRSIAPLLKSKTTDPAILVMDEKCKYIISLLSGHFGKANEKAVRLGELINAQPVITTASDVNNKIAVDTLAQELNLQISDMRKAKEITALIVNNKKVAIINESNRPLDNIKFSNNIEIVAGSDTKDDEIIDENNYQGIILISNKVKLFNIPCVTLGSKNLILGIGCKKGIDVNAIIKAIKNLFSELNLNINAIKTFATVDVKKDEQGIMEAAKHFNSYIKIISRDEIKKIENKFECSAFVKQTIGVGCVADPCGYIASKKGECISSKEKNNGITISVWRIINE